MIGRMRGGAAGRKKNRRFDGIRIRELSMDYPTDHKVLGKRKRDYTY